MEARFSNRHIHSVIKEATLEKGLRSPSLEIPDNHRFLSWFKEGADKANTQQFQHTKGLVYDAVTQQVCMLSWVANGLGLPRTFPTFRLKVSSQKTPQSQLVTLLFRLHG